VTIEDANMFARILNRNQSVSMALTMGATGCTAEGGCETVTSRNVIAEIKGSEYPNEIVVIGGHIDSWDVGQGAVDDADGAFIAWGALSAIKALGIVPKRTCNCGVYCGNHPSPSRVFSALL
jgi:carboxypeptidase Q